MSPSIWRTYAVLDLLHGLLHGLREGDGGEIDPGHLDAGLEMLHKLADLADLIRDELLDRLALAGPILMEALKVVLDLELVHAKLGDVEGELREGRVRVVDPLQQLDPGALPEEFVHLGQDVLQDLLLLRRDVGAQEHVHPHNFRLGVDPLGALLRDSVVHDMERGEDLAEVAVIGVPLLLQGLDARVERCLLGRDDRRPLNAEARRCRRARAASSPGAHALGYARRRRA